MGGGSGGGGGAAATSGTGGGGNGGAAGLDGSSPTAGGSGSAATVSGAGGGGGGGGGDKVFAPGATTISSLTRGTLGGTGGGSTGGTGGAGGQGGAAVAGTSVQLSIGSTATILGGTGGDGGGGTGAGSIGGAGGLGGAGVSLSPTSQITNAGTIAGGTGGAGGSGSATGGAAGTGGIALAGSGFTLTNSDSGQILGGGGGHVGSGSTIGAMGGGGAAISGQNLFITNNGIIQGGAPAGAALGGVAITGSTITIVNSGQINGGANGNAPPQRVNAIQFTGGINSLELRNGYQISGNVVAVNGGTDTLILGGTADSTFDASLWGTQYQNFAALTKTGASTWSLTNNNAATIPLTINAGTVSVLGLTSGLNVTVAGGVLAGSGTVGSVSVGNGGVLAPGTASSPFATLNVARTVDIASGAIFKVNVNAAGQNSAVAATGQVTIQGGSVQVVPASGTGFAPSTRYTILSSTAGVTGQFSGVTSNLAFLVPTLTYDANAVRLTLSVSGSGPTPDYRTVASNANQFAVATALTDAAARTGGTASVFRGLNTLSVPQAQAALSSISGAGLPAAQTAALTQGAWFSSLLTSVLVDGGQVVSVTHATPPVHELADLPGRAAPPAPPVAAFWPDEWRVWSGGFGGRSTLDASGGTGAPGVRDTFYGGAIGLDHRLNESLRIGIAAGASSGSFATSDQTTTGSTTAGHFALYGRAEAGASYVTGTAAYSTFDTKTDRQAGGIGGLAGETEQGQFAAREARGGVEFGQHFDVLRGTLTPNVGVEVAQLWTDGHTETAASGPGDLRLAIAGQRTLSVPTALGVRYETAMEFGDGIRWQPLIDVAWVHEFASDRNMVASLAGLPGTTFLAYGPRPARDAVRVRAGGTLKVNERLALFASFQGEFSRIGRLYAGTGGVKVLW